MDRIDWQQVFLNGEEPCFYVVDRAHGTNFCLRAKRWAGHGSAAHGFRPLDDFLKDMLCALEESVKLQSHYAEILNAYDGGQRKPFSSAVEWIGRLKGLGQLTPSMAFFFNALVVEPETHERMSLIADPLDNGDGSYTVIMESPSGKKWTHTIRTQEV